MFYEKNAIFEKKTQLDKNSFLHTFHKVSPAPFQAPSPLLAPQKIVCSYRAMLQNIVTSFPMCLYVVVGHHDTSVINGPRVIILISI